LYTDWYPRATQTFEQQAQLTETHGIRSWLAGQTSSAAYWVPPNVKVLDIGCSFGLTLAYHERRGCEAYGVEPDEHAAREGTRQGLKIVVGSFDPAMYEPSSFDYVTLDQTIEHVIDPDATLSGISRILKPGGRAIMSTPNPSGYGARVFGGRWINWHVPYHMHFFSRASMDHFARHAGLRVVSIRTRTASPWLEYQWMHLFSRPPSGEASAFWDSERTTRSMSRVAYRTGRLLSRLRILDLVTRLADTFGVGDSNLVVLEKPD
jgi:SAM-dependent methyltransferase